MLEARGVEFSYRAHVPVLRGIDLALRPGTFTAILGVNGCGKSTLMACLAGMKHPQTGEVLLDGVALREVGRRERAQKIALVAQHSHATRLTVYDSVLMGRTPHMQGAPSARDLAAVDSVLADMGLDAWALRYVDELSGGEYQKVVLARAFAQKAETLLLDEPTNNLDMANQHETMRLVRRAVDEGGIACAAVLHDVNLALRYCDTFLFLRAGRVDAYGGAQIVSVEEVERIYGIAAEVIEHGGRRLVVAG